MTTAQKPTRDTINITIADPDLVETLREIAADHHQPISHIAAKLLRRGLDALEDEADLTAVREAKGEPTVPWEQVKAEIRAAEAAEAADSAA